MCAVPVRSIVKSLVSLTDVLWFCKERKQDVAVYFEKAYDRVSCEFMFKVLGRMGIPERLGGLSVYIKEW